MKFFNIKITRDKEKEKGRNCLFKIEFIDKIKELPPALQGSVDSWLGAKENEVLRKFYSKRHVKIERDKQGNIFEICFWLENATFDANKNWLKEKKYEEIAQAFQPLIFYMQKKFGINLSWYLKLEMRSMDEFIKYSDPLLTKEEAKIAWEFSKKHKATTYGHLFREKYGTHS